MDPEALKRSYTILEIEPFSSKNRSSSVLISKNVDNTIHVHRKGAPDVIIPMCSHYYESSGTVKVISRSSKALLGQVLKDMAENGLRCFAFAHRKTSIRDYFTFSGRRLILLGIVGLKNPRRIGTRKTVQVCQKAGVNLKLITGDSLSTARVVATKCGLIEYKHRRGEVAQGREFRAFTDEERMAKVDGIRVLASATPEDKSLMVQCLKQKGHVVGYLGQGIGDVMALREANVALCFGTQGAEIAKARSAIVIFSKDILLITDIIKWGRGMYDSNHAYAQFLITSISVSLTVDVVTMFAKTGTEPPTPNSISTGTVPYPVFQLLWVKLITGTFAAVILIINPPAESVMCKPPSRKRSLLAPLVQMEICFQVLYQISVLLTIQFKGRSPFCTNNDEKTALILNTYILFQFFAMFDATYDKSNTFEEMQKNKVSWGIMLLIIIVQVLMLSVLKAFVGTTTLGWVQWAACTTMAASSLLVSWVLKNFMALDNLFKRLNMKRKLD